MLTDLRNRLRTVDRVDIMEAVNARAFRYYQGPEELNGLPAASELRRARILHAIGEDYVTTGRLDAALAVFREAQRTTAAQFARTPDDPETLRDHGRSESWIGRIYELRRQWPKALVQYRIFAGLAEHLNRVAPGNADYMKEFAWSAINLGNVQLANRDPGGAQASYERAVEWFERVTRVAPQDPNGPRILGNAYGWLADTYYVRRLYRQSLNARLRQYRLIAPLHRADPTNVDISFRFALAQRGVGASYLRLEDRAAARGPLTEAYETSSRLIQHDPRNADWLLFHGMIGCDLYFGRFSLPNGVTAARLREEVERASRSLAGQHNPRASDLSRCIGVMENEHQHAA
jgi:tetratricopeptide (TPR) repeat protein